MRRRRPREGERGGETLLLTPPPPAPPAAREVIRVLIARRQLCFMRRSSRDITFLSPAPAFSYIIYYIGVLNACTFLFRQTVNIIFDVAPFMRTRRRRWWKENVFTESWRTRVRTTTSVFASVEERRIEGIFLSSSLKW